MSSLMQKSIPPPFFFRSLLTMWQPGIENLLSEKMKSSLLSLTWKISKVSFINLFNDSNLFRNEFTLRCPRKTFLGCLLLKRLKVLRSFFCLLFQLRFMSRVKFTLDIKQITHFQSAYWFYFYLREYHIDYSDTQGIIYI